MKIAILLAAIFAVQVGSCAHESQYVAVGGHAVWKPIKADPITELQRTIDAVQTEGELHASR